MTDDITLPWCPECQWEADYDMHPIYAENRIPPPGSHEKPIDWNARCTYCFHSIVWRAYQEIPLERRMYEVRSVRMPDEPPEDEE